MIQSWVINMDDILDDNSTITEHEIQVIKDFFIIHICIFIIRESVSILLNKDNSND